VSDVIGGQPRWSIDPTRIELGFYSFSKLLMIRDLDPAAWGENSVLDHPLLRGLLERDEFRLNQVGIPESALF